MKVLVIAPHMDDEVLGAGGAIARHAERGDRVSVVIAANRAYGHKYVASAIRAEEACARQAQKVLGYQQLKFLRLPDEKLDQGKGLLHLIVPIEKALREAGPELVYLPYRADINQDHRAVHEAAVIACRPLAAGSPKRLVCYEVPSSTDQAPSVGGDHFAPNRYLPLTGRQLDKKVEALLCYTRELREFPHPRSAEGVRVLAAKRGTEIGVKAAEAFLLIREIVS